MARLVLSRNRAVVPTHVGVDLMTAGRAVGWLALSPRTWEWTGGPDEFLQTAIVVPTHVGVDLRNRAEMRFLPRCPHARGGGPAKSPAALCAIRVVPTHVGVDRGAPAIPPQSACCPHARGGGPRKVIPSIKTDSLSPRTWGWTCKGMHVPKFETVVPTHVGVDRRWRWRSCFWCSCPHARGGGPLTQVHNLTVAELSPRTWGWTFFHRRPRPHPRRCPHARGGGPGSAYHSSASCNVVPTHVGVDPLGGWPCLRAAVVPTHVGVDLLGMGGCNRDRELSPRTWGWTLSVMAAFARV